MWLSTIILEWWKYCEYSLWEKEIYFIFPNWQKDSHTFDIIDDNNISIGNFMYRIWKDKATFSWLKQ
jgi:hypothetical protein